MSELSNELVNELVAACVAFGRQVEPDWQTRIEKARSELKAYIEGLEPRWIPVSERLPDTGNTLKYYDVILEGEDSVAVALWDGWYKNWSLYEVGDGYVSTTLVTHWRERPTPPEVKA